MIEEIKRGTQKYKWIHIWLGRKYGKANHCENPDCKGESSHYEYALIHGKNHERKRENYIQLCKKCHVKYDDSARGIKGPKSPISIKKSLNTRMKNGIEYKGDKNPMYGRSAYTIWIEKYGIEEANRRKLICRKKMSGKRGPRKK